MTDEPRDEPEEARGAERVVVAFGEAVRRGAWWGLGAALGMVPAIASGHLTAWLVSRSVWPFLTLSQLLLIASATAFVTGLVVGAAPLPAPGHRVGAGVLIGLAASPLGFVACIGAAAVARGGPQLQGMRDVADAAAQVHDNELSMVLLLMAVGFGAASLAATRFVESESSPVRSVLAGAAVGPMWIAGFLGFLSVGSGGLVLPLAAAIAVESVAVPACALLAERARLRMASARL